MAVMSSGDMGSLGGLLGKMAAGPTWLFIPLQPSAVDSPGASLGTRPHTGIRLGMDTRTVLSVWPKASYLALLCLGSPGCVRPHVEAVKEKGEARQVGDRQGRSPRGQRLGGGAARRRARPARGAAGSENPGPSRTNARNALGQGGLGRSSHGEIRVLQAPQTDVPRKGWRVRVSGLTGLGILVAMNQIS